MQGERDPVSQTHRDRDREGWNAIEGVGGVGEGEVSENLPNDGDLPDDLQEFF